MSDPLLSPFVLTVFEDLARGSEIKPKDVGSSSYVLSVSLTADNVVIGKADIPLTRDGDTVWSSSKGRDKPILVQLIKQGDSPTAESAIAKGWGSIRTAALTNSSEMHINKPPSYYIDKLLGGPASLTHSLLLGLKTTLRSVNSEWISEFLQADGLSAVELATGAFEKSRVTFESAVSQCELISCVVAFLNNKLSLKQVIKTGFRSMTNFVKLLFTSRNTLMKAKLLDLMGAVALYSKSGYNMILNCLEEVEKKQGNGQKFFLLVKLLQESEEDTFRASCLSLVNCIISVHERLEFRLKMRSLFIHAGLFSVLESIRNQREQVDKSVGLQLSAFEDIMASDESAKLEIQNALQLQLDDPDSLFKEVVSHVAFEKRILSLLQYLLLIPYDQEPLAELIWSHLLKAAHHIIKMEKLSKDTHAELFYIVMLDELTKSVENNRKARHGAISSGVEKAEPPLPPPPKSKAHLAEQLEVPALPIPSPPPPPLGPTVRTTKIRIIRKKKLEDAVVVVPPINPPPLPSSKTPPPPPPPGTKRTDLPLKPVYKPAAKLKMFYWVKLNNASIMKAPAWAQIASHPEFSIDTTEIDSLFADLSIRKKVENKTNTVVRVLDMRKSNNVAVALARLAGISHQEIVQAVLHAKEGVLVASQIEILLKCIPTDEEVFSITSYKGEQVNLGEAEKYYLAISVVPRMEQKLKLLLLRDQFAFRVAELSKGLSTLKAAAYQLTTSPTFLRILEGILAVGNYLNYNSSTMSQAYGFKLDALRKLSDTKANGRNMSLLHYVIKIIEPLDSTTNMNTEIPAVSEAATISIEDLRQEVTKLELELNLFQAEQQKTDEPSTPFRKVYAISPTCNFLSNIFDGGNNFYTLAVQEIQQIRNLLADTNESMTKMFAYFGYDPKKEAREIENFFKMIVSFKVQYYGAKKDLQKELAKPKASTKAYTKLQQSSLTKSGSNEGLLDSIMDSIQKGTFLRASKSKPAF